MKRPNTRYFTDAQLERIRSNRCWASRLEPIGEVTRRVAAQTATGNHIDRIRDALDAITDDEFRAHCRLDSVTGGQVLVMVDDADLVYHMRVKWHLPIKEHLEQNLPRMTVRRVVFRTEPRTTALS